MEIIELKIYVRVYIYIYSKLFVLTAGRTLQKKGTVNIKTGQ